MLPWIWAYLVNLLWSERQWAQGRRWLLSFQKGVTRDFWAVDPDWEWSKYLSWFPQKSFSWGLYWQASRDSSSWTICHKISKADWCLAASHWQCRYQWAVRSSSARWQRRVDLLLNATWRRLELCVWCDIATTVCRRWASAVGSVTLDWYDLKYNYQEWDKIIRWVQAIKWESTARNTPTVDTKLPKGSNQPPMPSIRFLRFIPTALHP